ncbi:hypothetical protein E2C01_012816 [Portunus trituberculatus]|uniref:Uncharacterized protein n=1 Tax=Portunus trituberculatus TaxID=210409 RepID=A0A5B7DFP7_PORTR|nr:hypothetical protein [Portunus trituberculatus]
MDEADVHISLALEEFTDSYEVVDSTVPKMEGQNTFDGQRNHKYSNYARHCCHQHHHQHLYTMLPSSLLTGNFKLKENRHVTKNVWAVTSRSMRGAKITGDVAPLAY